MESLTLKQLHEKCASLNLKQYGTKATMIKRINEHEAKLREKDMCADATYKLVSIVNC